MPTHRSLATALGLVSLLLSAAETEGGRPSTTLPAAGPAATRCSLPPPFA